MANGNTPKIDPSLMMAIANQAQNQGQGVPMTLSPSLLSSPQPIPVTGQLTGTQQQQMSYQDLMRAIGGNQTLSNRLAEQQPSQPSQQPVVAQPSQQPVVAQPSQQPVVAQPQPWQPTDRGQQVQRSGQAPAAVRYNNPGAMWPGASSKKFGSSDYGVLKDGNLIAHFDNPVNGAAAQFDLLGSSKYVNQPIINLVNKWSGSTGGAENVARYAKSVANSMGVSPTDRLTPELLRGPAGIAFAKAQAKMETGYDYPLSDDQWSQAQRLAFPDITQR